MDIPVDWDQSKGIAGICCRLIVRRKWSRLRYEGALACTRKICSPVSQSSRLVGNHGERITCHRSGESNRACLNKVELYKAREVDLQKEGKRS